LEKKFPELPIKVSISRIRELPAENSSPMKVNPLIVTTSRKWADDDNHVVSLESNNKYKLDSWTFGNYMYIFSYKLIIYYIAWLSPFNPVPI